MCWSPSNCRFCNKLARRALVWTAVARICAMETKTMRVVHALAYNDTKEGTEENAELDLLVVPIWARLPKHVWPFDSLKLDRSRSSTNKFRGAPTSSGINPAGGASGSGRIAA
jgi:hypothetical protein